MEESWLQKSTKILVALLLVAGALDAATTLIGTQLCSYVETRAVFFPFLSTAILGAAVYGVIRISRSYQKLRRISFVLIVWLVAFAFTGGVSNLFVLGGI
jgi:hypothetical protein